MISSETRKCRHTCLLVLVSVPSLFPMSIRRIHITEPIVLHELDMATSLLLGILLLPWIATKLFLPCLLPSRPHRPISIMGFGGAHVKKSPIARSRHGCIPYSLSIPVFVTDPGHALFQEGQRLRMCGRS